MSIHEKKHAGLVEGKVVLVTGAGAGLGRATALLLAEEGAKVVVTDWAQQDGMDTLKVIKDAGGEAAFVLMDISKEEDIKAGIQFAIDTYGRLDCAVNNAAMEQERAVPMDEFSDEEWDRLMLVNLKGCFWCVKHEANAMLKNGGGSIVNISSIDGFKTPGPGYGLYDTAKAGVIHMTKAAAKDYGKTA
ncbi:MAG TPA: SDR family NAD(P)-dependent oxidoreductase, partial [Anaerovoracaceae bacterium]|nr:SDR family NAD(P)-dependent oxidoreductase [Anaerovoracaceae bacterium]